MVTNQIVARYRQLEGRHLDPVSPRTFGNETIALIKNSALVSLLTIHDLMHEGQKIISVSYRSLEVYLAIAVVYFILTGVTSLVLRRMELRLRAGGMVQ